MEFIQSLGYGELYSQVIEILLSLMQWFPYWGPFVLGYIFYHQWLHYVYAKWSVNIKWVLLEIKLPKEIHKSPMAMEIALNALYQTGGETTWYDRNIKGNQRDWFSLEMVSIEGAVKFFIRTNEKYKNIIEAQLYAQYPDIEIFEVPDYTRYVDYSAEKNEWSMTSIEFKLAKPDPYPIKTYIDYGLDKEGIKEEFKIDPLTSVIEYLGSIGKGEQIWIQILVRASKDRYHKKDGSMGGWKDEGKDLVAKLVGRDKKDEDDKFQVMKLTKGEQETIAAIERSIGKLGFDCGMRAVYLGKGEKFDMSNVSALKGLFRAFGTKNLNEFSMHSQTFGYDYTSQSYISFERFFLIPEISFNKDYFIKRDREDQFNAYKQRSWFYLPEKRKPFVLTTEELATIYHFPGGVAQTPTFGRIPSRKGEAPVNLPI